MKFPIGIQSFRKIREENYIYVDKTKDIYNLINEFSYVFLARPRRFGKSLLLDTLKCLFEGEKELFKGLYIYDRWDFEKYPVIKIAFSGNRNEEELMYDIFRNLEFNANNLGVECKSKDYGVYFSELIYNVYKKYQKKVVILIDEYDKPILDTLENKEISFVCRDILKRLYSQIKTNDEFIKFTFLTGVSKFSKASIFSGLNMLSDVSLLPKYGNICGITEEELSFYFKEYLENENLDEIKEWYNGYYFLKDKIFNPFDILQYLNNKTFDNYWFSSGNPNFLITLLKENKYYLPNLANLKTDEKFLDVFDIEKIDVEVLLFQAGYLTIKNEIKTPFGKIFKLYFPNKEVKVSFSDVIIEYFYNVKNEEKLNLYEALANAKIEDLISSLKRVFATIPYNNLTYIKGYEGFYSSIVYIYLQSLGFDIIGEDVTNKGRIDLSIFVEDKVYIIEFKVGNECNALEQIKEKKYYEKYVDKEVYLIGICFSEEEKNIISYEWEKL